MTAALLPQVLTQQVTGDRVQQTNNGVIPLDLNAAADLAWRRAIVRGFDFDATI
jgi:hypothetical protein